MVGVVHHRVIKQKQVLVGRAAAHEQAGGALATALHARLQLQGFNDVDLAKKGRQQLGLADAEVLDTHLGGFQLLLQRHGAFHHHLAQLLVAFFQVEAQPLALGQVQVAGNAAVADGGHQQLHAAGGQAQTVMAERVGRGAGFQGRHGHAGTRQGLAVRAVHGTAQRHAPGVLRLGQRGQQQHSPNQ